MTIVSRFQTLLTSRKDTHRFMADYFEFDHNFGVLDSSKLVRILAMARFVGRRHDGRILDVNIVSSFL